MTQLDELIARSQQPGRFVQRHRFTLSREKAIEKQREFALRHPQQYVLELIQAAVFSGATYIAIDTRPSQILIAWIGGRTLKQEELVRLLDYLFTDRADPKTRHLVQLAVGVNALLQRRPTAIRIETGTNDEGLRFDLDANGQAQVGQVESPTGGTYLYAEFQRSWFSRFSSRDFTPEQGLIEERCMYTPVPILLNGSAPFGYRGGRRLEIFGASDREHFDHGGRRGVLGTFDDFDRTTELRTVVGGVWITTVTTEQLASEPISGVVCDDGLRKTADHSDIVRDDRYVRMLHAIQPHATALLKRTVGPGYRAPALPPIPDLKADKSEDPDEIIPEAVEPNIPSLAPRAPMPLAALRTHDPERPIFCCAPHQAHLLKDAADPIDFPYPVLLLTPGQVLTVEKELDRTLHRLNSRSDVDFIRRIIERQNQLRTTTITLPHAEVELRLHLEGAMPDWGPADGIPFVIEELKKRRTEKTGHILRDKVILHGENDGKPAFVLSTALELPRISLRFRPLAPNLRLPDDAIVQGIIDALWRLAVPEDGPHDALLLCALFGQAAVPKLQPTPESTTPFRVRAALPSTWPDDLAQLPMIPTPEGDRSLIEYLDLLGTYDTFEVTDERFLEALDGLEARFGYGHLTHPSLENRGLFGVGRMGEQWIFLDGPSLWRHPALSHLIWVSATFSPHLADEGWVIEAHPFPEIAAASRIYSEDVDWRAGYEMLFRKLAEFELTDNWGAQLIAAPLLRTRALGRLALLHLATWLEKTDDPLLLPTDGGGRRSLRQVFSEPAARVIPREGVVVTEPWTFALTADELAAIDPRGTLPLRFDDGPEVWRDLLDGDDAGWLIRLEVHYGGLQGWLGLRHPYDGTTGILVQGSGRLIALPEMDRQIPCHGLLQSVRTGSELTDEQRRLLYLAGLQLYDNLALALQTGALDTERRQAARLYGFAFALLAAQRGRLNGTALSLARQIDVYDAEGHPWGTVEEWLKAAPEQRPSQPEEVVFYQSPAAPEDAEEGAQLTEESTLLHRLSALLTPAGLTVRISDAFGDGTVPLTLRGPRRMRRELTLIVDLNHPLADAGFAKEGPAREALLLEAARLFCAWADSQSVALRLTDMHQILLAQRLNLGS